MNEGVVVKKTLNLRYKPISLIQLIIERGITLKTVLIDTLQS